MMLRVIDVRVERCGAVHTNELVKWGACFAGGATTEALGLVIPRQPPGQGLLAAR